MKEEKWLPIVGYESLYEVSDLGRVRSLDRVIKWGAAGSLWKPGRVLKQKATKPGYRAVTLSVDGVRKFEFVHRCVAKAFLREPLNESEQVNHIDLDKVNNRLANLEWVTPQGNIDHAVSAGRWNCANGKPATALTIEIVNKIRHMSAVDRLNGLQIAAALGVTAGSVHDVISGRRWRTVSEGRRAPSLRSALDSPGKAKKLTLSDVAEIRRIGTGSGMTLRELGELFGVGQTAVHNVLHSKTWGPERLI